LGDQVIGTDIRLTNISTGTGTSFPSYGNYDVSLSITWLGDPAISDTDTALVSIGGSGGGGVPIPEPATLLVFGTGLFAIGIIGWRRRRHRIRGPDWLGVVEGRRTRL
jgi:hypothetical protein